MADTRAHPFPSTSRTLLEALQSPQESEREVSMERFCLLYQLPIYSWLRMHGQTAQDAQDHMQIFLMTTVWQNRLAGFDLERGTKFRSWLTACLRNQVIKEHEARKTLKRGGGKVFVPFDLEILEKEVHAAQAARLEPEPTFDLLLAREIWRVVGRGLTAGKTATAAALVRDLLPLTLVEKWPPPPFPSQQEMAERHGTTMVRLRAHFNHTLRRRVRRDFDAEARACSPGITVEDLDYLWQLLRRFGEGQ